MSFRCTSLTHLLLLLLSSCAHDKDTEWPPRDGAETGTGLFSEGCPQQGSALAREIGVEGVLPGEVAVGTRGDFLLANAHAAFAITDVEGQATYWYYGGALADAVPMDGCVPGEDKLDEVGIVLAEIDLGSVEQSTVRGFRADTVEVLNDGSDGEAAVVRATGTDDMHWLVEYTLIGEAINDGGRPLSEPFGTEIVVDYVLPPDSPVLRIEVGVTNVGDGPFTLVEAALISLGPTLEQTSYASDALNIAGFDFDGGLPWVMATDGRGAYAWGIGDATLATMSIAGINIIADLAQLSDGLNLLPGQQRTLIRYLSVGAAGGTSATEPLLEANPVPLLGQPADVGVIAGQVVDSAGRGVQTQVVTQALAPGAAWDDFDAVPTASDGRFRVVVPAFDDAWNFRVLTRDPARDASSAVNVQPGQADVQLVVPPRGTLTFEIVDDAGAPSPGRIYLEREDGTRRDFWVAGTGALDLPPGQWEWVVTRGYEYASVEGMVQVPEDGVAQIDPVLVHVVDTSGWMSVDTHVHTSDSPDSDIDQATQLRHAAAHGLEIVIHTEHEAIVDRSAVPAEAGVEAWVNNITGEEVTSVTIEHMTMFPAVPDGSIRGAPVAWYGLDIATLFGNMRERSEGGVTLINHPGYLDRIGWDRVTAAPTLADPTLLGLPSDAPLWSWDLDGIEVMNGHGSPFQDGNRRFDNWMSMVNAGHQVVGVGCSDDHHGREVGFPRTYYRSVTDDPDAHDSQEMTAAFHAGQLQASAGGFARVEIDGAGPGDLVTDVDGLVDLDVYLEALPEIDMTHFVVFVNCDQVDSVRVTDPVGVEKYSGLVPLNLVGDSQVVIAAFGSEALARGMPQYDATRVPRVLTSPIYVDGDGDGAFSAPGGRECVYDLDESVAL